MSYSSKHSDMIKSYSGLKINKDEVKIFILKQQIIKFTKMKLNRKTTIFT